MAEHILFAYEFDGKGGGTSLAGEAISQKLEDEVLAWVHLDANHENTKGWLEKEIAYLDPFIIEALLDEETRPRMTQIGDGALIFLRGVNLNENEDPEDMVTMRLWIDDHRIISMRRRKLKTAVDIKELLKKGTGPKNSGEFIGMLTERLFDRMEPVLGALDDATDAIEEKLLEGADAKLREAITDVRMQAIMFRRYMAPQREAIGQLRMAELSWLSDRNRRHLQESYNQVTRYVEDLEAIRERSQIIKDEIATTLADQLNKNMYVLSVIAAIFLPLGFLTGLLGINVGGIPGTDNDKAFYIFSGILTVLVLAQIWLFKRFKWF